VVVEKDVDLYIVLSRTFDGKLKVWNYTCPLGMESLPCERSGFLGLVCRNNGAFNCENYCRRSRPSLRHGTLAP
jgi:hypothetical protein